MEELADEVAVLARVAVGEQETLTELLWRVGPECPNRHLGVHVRPAGSTADGPSDVWPDGAPAVWCCRGPVGELAAALPGKRRREARRGEHRGGRG